MSDKEIVLQYHNILARPYVKSGNRKVLNTPRRLQNNFFSLFENKS